MGQGYQRKWSSGQSAVEFALTIPILLLLVFGMIDLCRYYFTEQSVSYTLRSAARYAVTGQLQSNSSYSATNASSFPYLPRRESIIRRAMSNNPGLLDIHANMGGYSTNDNFTMMSSTNYSGPWATNSTSGAGGDYVRFSLAVPFDFITPFADLLMSSLFEHSTNGSTPSTHYNIQGSIIMKNEQFRTNAYPSTNGTGALTNYWN